MAKKSVFFENVPILFILCLFCDRYYYFVPNTLNIDDTRVVIPVKKDPYPERAKWRPTDDFPSFDI